MCLHTTEVQNELYGGGIREQGVFSQTKTWESMKWCIKACVCNQNLEKQGHQYYLSFWVFIGGPSKVHKWIKFWCHEYNTFDQRDFWQFGNLRPLARYTNHSFRTAIHLLLRYGQRFIDFGKLTSVSNEMRFATGTPKVEEINQLFHFWPVPLW